MSIHWLTMIKWTVHEKIQSICRWRFNNLQQFILLYVKIWWYNNRCRFKKVQLNVCNDGGSTEHDILLRVSMWWLTDMQSYVYPKMWQYMYIDRSTQIHIKVSLITSNFTQSNTWKLPLSFFKILNFVSRSVAVIFSLLQTQQCDVNLKGNYSNLKLVSKGNYSNISKTWKRVCCIKLLWNVEMSRRRTQRYSHE